jgi:hypothetical protein
MRMVLLPIIRLTFIYHIHLNKKVSARREDWTDTLSHLALVLQRSVLQTRI